MNVITVSGLTKSFGRHKAVDNLNFKVDSGDFFGLVGPNKSGKSTTLNLLMDFVSPTKGTAEIFGMNCQDGSDEIKKQVGYIPSHPAFYDEMKVSSILKMVKQFFYESYDTNIEEFLCERFNINPKKRVGQLTFSAQKRLAIVCAVVRQPKLILMDEPTLGLDPIMYNRFYETMFELQEDGVTAIMADQQLSNIEDICNVVAVIREGEILESKSLTQIKKKRGKFVHVAVEGDISDMMLSLGAKQFMKKDGVVSFIYNSDVNRLIKSLAKFKIDDLSMEDMPIENELSSYNDAIYYKETVGANESEKGELLPL